MEGGSMPVWRVRTCLASRFQKLGHVNRGYSVPVGALVVARGNGPVALAASLVSSENSPPDERHVWMCAKSYFREEQSLGWIRSQRLPYRSRKTATVP